MSDPSNTLHNMDSTAFHAGSTGSNPVRGTGEKARSEHEKLSAGLSSSPGAAHMAPTSRQKGLLGRAHSHAPRWLMIAAVGIVIGLTLDATADKARAATTYPTLERCALVRGTLDRRACIVRNVFRSEGRKAVAVAMCESRLDPRARNGQYRGVFQMGSSERARFGHGRTVLAQARAAKRYHSLSGWSPWSCA